MTRSFQVHLDLLFERTERLERRLNPEIEGSLSEHVDRTYWEHEAALKLLRLEP